MTIVNIFVCLGTVKSMWGIELVRLPAVRAGYDGLARSPPYGRITVHTAGWLVKDDPPLIGGPQRVKGDPNQRITYGKEIQDTSGPGPIFS
jgi:hypothetical protein